MHLSTIQHVKFVKAAPIARCVCFLQLLTMSVLCQDVNAQILWLEDCFNGGVLTSGVDNAGSSVQRKCKIKWNADHTIRAAYALTYRYGRPTPHVMKLNGAAVKWNMQNQVGPEQIETNEFSNFFAPHATEISSEFQITDDTLVVDFPPQEFYDFAWNWGWWGVYVVILYESPSIDYDVCTRIYIADQDQVTAQNYEFEKPSFISDTPLLFAIHSGRLSNFESDASLITLNEQELGVIWGADQVVPPPSSGVHGHFYYENHEAFGLNGDTANNTMYHHDGIVVINNFLNQTTDTEFLNIQRVISTSDGSFNPHPSFNLTYTPSCPVISTDAVPRSYAMCRGDTVQLSAAEGFDHYTWSPAAGLSDTAATDPLCFADSSGWYSLRMWNDDAAQGCPATIPVWVEVGQTPRPNPLTVTPTGCTANSGRIRFEDPAGTPPFAYSVGEASQPAPLFTGLAAGEYEVSVTAGDGCVWDSLVVLPFNINHTAAFTANPAEGVTPLDVQLLNQSTGADGYIWSVDGAHLSNAANTSYTFADSGAFEVQLIAFRGDTLCADTAAVTIFVDPGIELELPNIITPNGDGRNDRLVARVLGARSLRWEVFNRWGHAMHSGEAAVSPYVHEDVVLWDPPQVAPQGGTNRRNPRPEDAISDGVYMLVITTEGLGGKIDQVKQTVTVVR